MRFYNYVYLDPRKPGRYSYEDLNLSFLFEPFYVGKGSGERLFSHLAAARSKKRTLKVNKIKAILREGHDLRSYILQINEGLSSKKAYNREIQIIKMIGRISFKTGPLTNMTDGGEGGEGNNGNKGAHRQKISEHMKIRSPKQWKNPEYREKVSKAISQTLMGHSVPDNVRKKISHSVSLSQLDKCYSENHKKGISEGMKKMYAEHPVGWFNDGNQNFRIRKDDPRITSLSLLSGSLRKVK